MAGVLEDLAKLKAEAARAQTLRASAEANLGVVKRQLEEVDSKLRALGIDPGNAEQALSDLEAQLATTIGELRMRVAEETAAYDAILQQTAEVLR
jgi:septal ring factor EnvC (AmiA/AmiB activator)